MKISFKVCLSFILVSIGLSTICVAQSRDKLPPKSEIRQTLQHVADWQIANFTYSTKGNASKLHDYGIDAWTNATFFLGLTEWSRTLPEPESYRKWLMEIGEETRWKLPHNFIYLPRIGVYHADELCIGQFYLAMYDIYKNMDMIDDTRNRLDAIITYPPKEDISHRNKQAWTWCDALFMAPPVYAHMSQITKDEKYLAFMNKEFRRSYDHLYSPTDSLFFRDDSYFNQTEENGQPVFWGRGNGWVAAGLANMLKHMPSGSSERPFYEELFVKLCTKLANLQSTKGFWHASLLDPDTYPNPETSATALIAYALAYGVNEGLLDKEMFEPIIVKSWNALISVIDEDGKLGFVQPIGANPKAVTHEMTAVYGPGALLLAGIEILRLSE